MSTIQDDYKTNEAQKNAALYLNQIETLLSQEAAAIATRSALKIQIKADIANNIFNKDQIREFLDADELINSVSARKPDIKAALAGLKTEVNDPTYEAEIQTVIDSL